MFVERSKQAKMPIFTITLHYTSESSHSDQEKPSQKSYWEDVIAQLRQRGARIINVQSTVGKVGEPPRPINVVTITYEAPTQIRYTGG